MNAINLSEETRLMVTAAEDKMQVAMTLLPDELTASYREACRLAPELIEKESNPNWFLKFHPADPLAAARRLANYWKKRKEVFQERAFLPIDLSGNGAMTVDDVRILRTGYTINLPRDKKGRSVIYSDYSKKRPEMIPSLRMIFFYGQFLMENEMSRNDGFVILWNISNPFAADFVKVNQECGQTLMRECMPLQNLRFYLIYVSPTGTAPMPLFINTVFTWAVSSVASFYGKSVTAIITSSKDDCLAKFMKYNMAPEGLPVGLGGSWTGGCEPWRKGNPDGDELTLDIETDLSCLFRTTLWCHEQTVAAKHIQTTAASAAAAAGAGGMHQASPIRALNVTTSEPPEDSSSMSLSATRRQHAKREDRSNSVGGTKLSSPKPAPTAISTASSSSHPSTQEQNMNPTSLATAGVASAAASAASPSRKVCARPSRSKLVETAEQTDARRAKENYYANRKRDRGKHLLEGLLEEQERLTTSNNALRVEGNRLQELLDAAQQREEE